MDVKQAITERRAYRSLDPTPITEELIKDLAGTASLAPSCNNFQPWRFVFVQSRTALKTLHTTLSQGNEWAQAASCIVAVYSKKDLDCQIPGRDYYLFDTGMATAFLILRATELGLVAHPIAGYDENRVKELLGIPKEMTVITLVNIGKHSSTISSVLTPKQAQIEKARPPRKPLEETMSIR